jgi:hypothetical protein
MSWNAKRRPGGAVDAIADRPRDFYHSARLAEPSLRARSAALRSRGTARCISATGHSFQMRDVGHDLEHLAGDVAGLAAIVARTAGQGR